MGKKNLQGKTNNDHAKGKKVLLLVMLTVLNYEKKHGMFGSMEKNEYLCHQDAHPATFLQERGFQE